MRKRTRSRQKLRTREEAREWLRAHGVSQREFARRMGVNPSVVHDLLRMGPKRPANTGLRGDPHRVAIALGLKAVPTGQSPLEVAAIMAQDVPNNN